MFFNLLTNPIFAFYLLYSSYPIVTLLFCLFFFHWHLNKYFLTYSLTYLNAPPIFPQVLKRLTGIYKERDYVLLSSMIPGYILCICFTMIVFLNPVDYK